MFGIDRTSNTMKYHHVDVETLVIDAFSQLGITAEAISGRVDRGVDVLIDPEGVAVPLHLKWRSLVTDDVAGRLLADATPGGTLLVAADRVTDSARTALISGGAGYLDLRGRLALRSERLVIDAEIPSIVGRASRSEALSGTVGLEVATALLMDPGERVSVRGLARHLGRSPSTVSEVLAALRREGLVDEANLITGTGLFWQVADRWPRDRTFLVQAPSPDDPALRLPLRLGLDDVTASGWALTDSVAAAAYGAPLAVRSDQILDFFVPDIAVLRRATTLLGEGHSPATVRATVRVAPVPVVVRERVHLEADHSAWPLAHPLFVALDLAQDDGRGREILDTWTPDQRWTRVW